MKNKKLYSCALVAVALGLIALVGHYIGTKCYTFDWILNHRLYLLAAILVVVGVYFWRWRFSLSVFAGVFLGVLCGELFGPDPAGVEFGFGHYGWAIWLLFFLVSVLAGVAIEVFYSKKHK